MPAKQLKLRESSRFHRRAVMPPSVIRPRTLKELRECLVPGSPYAPPFRPMGAGSSSTDCIAATAGTVIDMSAFDEIVNIDAYEDTAVVQPGVRLGRLASALAHHGLELAGSHDLAGRTVGGAIAGGCTGPNISDGGFFASQALSMKVVTPSGRLLEISRDKQNLLNAFRLSYGMLGTICEITLKVRPVTPFAVAHRRCTIEQFAAAAERLCRTDIGVKFYLMPFRDRVYLDLRRYTREAAAAHRIPWKIKDWGESTVLPHVFKSLNRIVPVPGVRYRIIDEISRMTQGIVNNRFVSVGSNSTAAPRGDGPDRQPSLNYSTWVFPAADFSIVVQAYREFCLRIRKQSGFRCDLPTMGFRVARDRSALLSPSFDEPMFALSAVSTQTKGWEDFVLDFAEFAEQWGGMPFFNQTRSLTAAYCSEAFGSRLDFFRRIRRQLDPDNRMMNPFLLQYFA
ncbi:MAG TPA: FAD-binding oxidoreductase [Woeseiaceae bacterium]